MRCKKGEEWIKPYKRKKKGGSRKSVEVDGYCRKKRKLKEKGLVRF